MGKFGRGLQLLKMSFSVIRKDKELLLFPVISGLLLIAIAASFIIPIFILTPIGTDSFNLAFIAFWAIFYFISFFVSTFFNVAIIGCALMRMDGGDPTLSYGFRYAAERVKLIALWALVSATVGLILRAIENQVGFIGKIIVGFIGLAWTIATYFVIPVIAVEKLTPFKAMKRSASILKNAWGEALVSNLGIGLIFALLFLAGFIVGLIGMLYCFIYVGVVAGLIVLAIFVIYIVFLAVLSTTVSAVLMAALYRFATTGKTVEGFSAQALSNPWSL